MESVLLQQGLAGIVIMGLSATVIKLNKDNKLLYDKINELQEKRLHDAIEYLAKYTEVMGNFSQTKDILLYKLEKSKHDS